MRPCPSQPEAPADVFETIMSRPQFQRRNTPVSRRRTSVPAALISSDARHPIRLEKKNMLPIKRAEPRQSGAG